MADTVLSIATRAVLDACGRLGLDPGDLLHQAGLTRAGIDDRDARLPAARADALWRAAISRADDPHLALHAAEAVPFGAYTVIDFLAASSGTVGEALRRIAGYFAIIDPRAVLRVEDGDPAELTMRSRDEGVELPPPAQEFTLAVLVLHTRGCAGPGWAPGRVELAFEAPPDTSEHRRVFGTEVRFACPAPRLVLPRAAWEAPVHGRDPALAAMLDGHARRLLEALPQREGLVEKVRGVLMEELSGGEPTVARIARRLAMSQRTLQRRLRDEGHTLASLLDEARAAAARAHLADPSLSLAEIAWLLGFSDQSTFTRAFRRWTGRPPGAFRSTTPP